MSSSLTLSWAVSTLSGYGIYGLQIIMQFLRRGGDKVILTHDPALTVLPALTQIRLNPIIELGRKIAVLLKDNPKEILSFDHPALHACGNDFSGFDGQDRVWGKPNVGCAAIEHLMCSPHGRKISVNYDLFLAISRWNEAFLKSLDIGPVYLCHQGIDTTLFQPGPRTNLWRDRFVIFSGGKFEFRKGQDIVLAAFKRFYARHPDALLLCCWQNLLMPDAAAFALAGHCQEVPKPATDFGLQMTPWLLQQGLAPGSFIDLGFTHNMMMPQILRECDVAVFPNRCEGGTNLVAMEAMACGVPTFVANNTGQKDLVDMLGCGAFKAQKPVVPAPAMKSVQDWGETDPDEVVGALEYAYTEREKNRREALLVADKIKSWEWGLQNDRLLEIVYEPGRAQAAQDRRDRMRSSA